jgi:hypothetical protein
VGVHPLERGSVVIGLPLDGIVLAIRFGVNSMLTVAPAAVTWVVATVNPLPAAEYTDRPLVGAVPGGAVV